MGDINEVTITLASNALRAGAVLEGTLSVQASSPVRGLELSVLWLTTGRGDADEGVAHFEKIPEDACDGRAIPLEVRLPLAPTSYSGEKLEIAWMVRVRDASGNTWDEPFTMVP
jgi:hypothetical protein